MEGGDEGVQDAPTYVARFVEDRLESFITVILVQSEKNKQRTTAYYSLQGVTESLAAVASPWVLSSCSGGSCSLVCAGRGVGTL
jgi:hypothetical protein